MRSRASILRKWIPALTACCLWLAGCAGGKETAEPPAVSSVQMMELNRKNQAVHVEDWYGTSYEIFPYSFADSDGDGIGDIRGIIENLDYLNDGKDDTYDDLGVQAVWLTPVCQAVSYHKYDVTDYLSIDSQFGTMEDYEQLVQECHQRGMKVLFDLVVNHTASDHPWFQKAVSYLQRLGDSQIDPQDCPYAGYYNFTRQSGAGYSQVPGTGWYYEARFWSGMPDLNLDSEEVRGEIRKILSFWLEKGVDGFRLDAVTSYYTGRDAENIAFLSWLNEAVKSIRPESYLVGEAWTMQDVYASYYQSGVDSFFDFAYAGVDGRICQTVRGTMSASDFVQSLAAEEEEYRAANPDCINAPFYTNHDMNRSAGYYSPDDGTKAKLAGALNLLMQGNAYVYYGEELGMKGSGKDENKRAPMYWSQDPQAAFMCEGPADMDEVEMKYPSLQEQKEDPLSVYCYYREAIRLRNCFPALARGATVFRQDLSDGSTAAFERQWNGQSVLVVMNLSEEEAEADVSAGGFTHLSGMLTVTQQAAEAEGGILRLPAYGIAVLEKE